MGIINPRRAMPEELLDATKRPQVIAWLVKAPYGSGMKIGLLRGWAAMFQVSLTRDEYNLVGGSSVHPRAVEVPREKTA